MASMFIYLISLNLAMNHLKLLIDQETKRYDALPMHQRRVVIFKMDDLAMGKGYKSSKEVQEKRPYIWNEMLVQAMQTCYPEGV